MSSAKSHASNGRISSGNNHVRANERQQLVMAAVDLVLINVAFVVAYFIRYRLEVGGAVEAYDYISLAGLLPLQATITLVILLVLMGEGAYRWRRGTPLVDQVVAIARATLVGLTIVLFAYLIYRPVLPSRLLFAFVWVMAVLALSGARVVQAWVRSWQRRRGIGVERVLVVGAGPEGRAIMQSILARPELGYQLVGFVDDDPTKCEDIGRARAYGTTENVSQVVDSERIDQVIITLPWVSHSKVLDIMAHCQRRRVNFRIVPDLFQLSLSQVDTDEIDGIPLIGLREVSIGSTQGLVKRALEVVVSAAALVLLSPLLLLVAVLIKLDSRGPALFRQERIGRGGKEFNVYKFRTMREGAEAEQALLAERSDVKGITFKIRDDPRRTRVGCFLRRWSIDELPQFINVLRGDMSVVGPRPPLPSEVARYEEWHRQRLQVSPGITGLWQVMGRSDLPFAEMVMMDMYYIENWSLSLDVKIMLQTLPSILSGRGAY
jgi:exopolysaccharide biosynthesis polyprenyl glycosylphosphotransferase